VGGNSHDKAAVRGAAAEAVRVKFSEADWISVYAASQGHEVP